MSLVVFVILCFLQCAQNASPSEEELIPPDLPQGLEIMPEKDFSESEEKSEAVETTTQPDWFTAIAIGGSMPNTSDEASEEEEEEEESGSEESHPPLPNRRPSINQEVSDAKDAVNSIRKKLETHQSKLSSKTHPTKASKTIPTTTPHSASSESSEEEEDEVTTKAPPKTTRRYSINPTFVTITKRPDPKVQKQKPKVTTTTTPPTTSTTTTKKPVAHAHPKFTSTKVPIHHKTSRKPTPKPVPPESEESEESEETTTRRTTTTTKRLATRSHPKLPPKTTTKNSTKSNTKTKRPTLPSPKSEESEEEGSKKTMTLRPPKLSSKKGAKYHPKSKKITKKPVRPQPESEESEEDIKTTTTKPLKTKPKKKSKLSSKKNSKLSKTEKSEPPNKHDRNNRTSIDYVEDPRFKDMVVLSKTKRNQFIKQNGTFSNGTTHEKTKGKINHYSNRRAGNNKSAKKYQTKYKGKTFSTFTSHVVHHNVHEVSKTKTYVFDKPTEKPDNYYAAEYQEW